MKQRIKRIADHLFSFSKSRNDDYPVKTEQELDTPVMMAQIFPSNVLRGTNPDLPLKTACQGQAAPETPAPAETTPTRQNRNCRIKIRFTEKEYAALIQAAQKAGTDRSKFIRAKLAASQVLSAPTVDAAALAEKVNRVGRRIDDIRAHANITGFIDAPELRKALDELHAVCQEILTAFAVKGGEQHE